MTSLRVIHITIDERQLKVTATTIKSTPCAGTISIAPKGLHRGGGGVADRPASEATDEGNWQGKDDQRRCGGRWDVGEYRAKVSQAREAAERMQGRAYMANA